MAIKREIKLMIAKDMARIDDALYVYQHDRGIDLTFDIRDNKFSITGDASKSMIREDIYFASITVLRPDGTSFVRPQLPIEENRVVFTIEHEHTHDFKLVGDYKLQIHLHDKFGGRVTIPEFVMQVKALIADFCEEEQSTDAVVDMSLVDVATVANEGDRMLFVIDGQYIRTIWKSGDLITASKLNKIEVQLEGLTEEVIALKLNPGIPGADGKSAYEIAVENGFVGTVSEWLESLQGADGAKGEQGLAGADGKSVELQKNATHIQWKQTGGNWQDLIALEELKGEDGAPGLPGGGGEVDLSNYYTKGQTDSAIATKIAEAINALDIPSLDGYATEAWVTEQLANVSVDLSDYAKKGHTHYIDKFEDVIITDKTVSNPPVTRVQIETLRPGSDYRAIYVVVDKVPHLLYTTMESNSTIFSNSGGFHIQLNGRKKASFKLDGGAWVEAVLEGDKVTSQEELASKILFTETPLNGLNVPSVAKIPYVASKIDSTNKALNSGLYLVDAQSGNLGTTLTPPFRAILDVKNTGDFTQHTLFATDNTVHQRRILGSNIAPWTTSGNIDMSTYATIEFVTEQLAVLDAKIPDMTEYYTKSQVDAEIAKNTIDPNLFYTKDVIDEMIGTRRINLINRTNGLIDQFIGEEE